MAGRLPTTGTMLVIRNNMSLGDRKRPWPEIAEQLGIKVSTVYRRVAEERARLRREKADATLQHFGENTNNPEYVPMYPEAPQKPLKQQLTAEELYEQALSTSVMTRDERLRALSWLAQNAPHAVQVQAIAKLEEFERSSGAQFGPPPPTTDAEIVTFLCDLFNGLNKDLILEAMNRVFTPNTPENTQTSPPDTSSGDMGGRET